MKISKHFYSHELLPPSINDKYFYNVIDYRIVETLESIRFWFGVPVYMNTWKSGGEYQYRGYRPTECTEGAVYSQHRFGRAGDCIVSGYEAEEVRTFILKNREKFPHITRLEKKVSWVHLDIMYTGKPDIVLF